MLGILEISADKTTELCSMTEFIIEGKQEENVCSFKIKQVFIHTGLNNVNCWYNLPIDYKLCIHDFEFRIGSKIIKPMIEEKESAKEMMREARENGITAIKADYGGKGVMSIDLGELPPHIECVVEITIAFVPKVRKNGFEITFPMIVPKNRGKSNGLAIYCCRSFSFCFEVSNHNGIKDIVSNITGTTTLIDDHCMRFVTNDKPYENNIIINVLLSENCINHASFYGTHMLISGVPQFATDFNTPNSNFFFIVDCSGSMSGARIKKAVDCLKIFIRSLPNGCFFDIICFGSSYQTLMGHPVRYDSISLSKALSKIDKIDANLGGTLLLPPLEFVFDSHAKSGFVNEVFVLTDGKISNYDEVIAAVSLKRDSYRIFTIGVGNDVDASLIETMASVSNGTGIFVNDNEEFGLVEKVIDQLESACSVALSDIMFEIDSHDTYEIVPFPLAPLFHDTHYEVVARSKSRFSSESSACFMGEIKGNPIHIPFVPVDVTETVGKSIEAIFSLKMIQEFQRKITVLQTNKESFQNEKNALIELSIASNILSRYTSFIGIDLVNMEGVVRPKAGKHGHAKIIPKYDYVDPSSTSTAEIPVFVNNEKKDIVEKKKEESILIENILAFQNADGSFQDISRVIPFQSIDSLSSFPIQIQYTVFALAVLNALCPNSLSFLRIIIRKAMSTLYACDDVKDWHKSIEESMSVISISGHGPK